MKQQGMKRLCDAIRAEGVVVYSDDNKVENGWKPAVDGIMNGLAKTQPIVLDNVADYVYSQTTPDQWEASDKFPNVAPPFSQVIYEYHQPKFFNGDDPKATPRFVGFFASSSVISEMGPVSLERLGPHLAEYPQAHWATFFIPIIMTTFSPKPFVLPLMFSALIDSQGELLQILMTGSEGQEKAMLKVNSAAIYQSLIPILVSISFMHCKNVKVVDQRPSRALSKAHQRRTGKPLIAFRTLDINPMKKVLAGEGRIGEVGLKRAMHVCRGHFKNLQASRYKEKGLHWWPAHVRGSLDEGIVMKNYNVKKPQEVRA